MLGGKLRQSLQNVIRCRGSFSQGGELEGGIVGIASLQCIQRAISILQPSVGVDSVHVENDFPSADGASQQQQLLVEVGVLGVPNAGKSTLTNALVGSKISAVSDKTNTTVRSRLGAFTSGMTQVVLFDTPGVVGPGQNISQSQLRRIESAWKTAGHCNVLLLVIDAHRQLIAPDPRVFRLVDNLGSRAIPGLGPNAMLPPTALVLNKVDAVKKEHRPLMLPLVDKLRDAADFEEVFWISALRGHGVEDVRSYLLDKGVPKGWTVPEDASTDATDVDVAVEIVREKIFRAYYKEIPYEVVLAPVSYKHLVDGSIRIEMDILVRSENLRGIVVGNRGAAIGSVGKSARLELESMWKKRVHLFLNVKVAK